MAPQARAIPIILSVVIGSEKNILDPIVIPMGTITSAMAVVFDISQRPSLAPAMIL